MKKLVGAHQVPVEGWLDHEELVPRKGRRGWSAVLNTRRRNDVEDGGENLVGMIEDTGRPARAAVKRCSEIFAGRVRRSPLSGPRHGAEPVRGRRRPAGLAIAVAAQVGGRPCGSPGQPRRESLPGQMARRIAVHEQKRRPAAAMHGDDARAEARSRRGKPSKNMPLLPLNSSAVLSRGKR